MYTPMWWWFNEFVLIFVHEAYFHRGCAKYNNYQKDAALQDYLKTIEINPEYLQAYFNIGMYYRGINDYDMACYYFKIAEAKPTHIEHA